MVDILTFGGQLRPSFFNKVSKLKGHNEFFDALQHVLKLKFFCGFQQKKKKIRTALAIIKDLTESQHVFNFI